MVVLRSYRNRWIKNTYALSLTCLLVLTIFTSCTTKEEDSPVADHEAPTSPTNLVAENTTLTTTDLRWKKATDNVGIRTYLIFKDDENLVANSTTDRRITGLEPNTTYTFKVQAKDNAGNISGFSNEVSVKTQSVEKELYFSSGELEDYMAEVMEKFPGSSGNDYIEPTGSELDIWDSTIDAILEENLEVAVERAAEINYKITEFTDTSLSPNQVFYILEDNINTNFWGTYIFSKDPERENLVIQAPHIKYDLNTGRQAVYVFKQSLGRALFINGTHRCNNTERSSCSGTTSTCSSSSEAYRISDLAHNVTSAFQKTTEHLFENIPNSVFIQLHGFGKKESDPYVIMSNGTRETPNIDYAVQIRDALLVEDNSLTFKIAHIDTDWSRLNGFTNTQGLLINNSSDPCGSLATSSTGRFIHIEQEKSKLREGPVEWDKMSKALQGVF